LSLWKDAAYFKWRYDQNPSRSYKYQYLELENKIEALCVCALSKDKTYEVLELIARNHSVRNSRYLIASVALYACKQGAARINFSGASLSFFEDSVGTSIFYGFFACESSETASAQWGVAPSCVEISQLSGSRL